MSASDDAPAKGDEESGRRQRRKQPFISAFLSVLIAGLGQVYNGQYLRGTGLIFLAFVFMFVALAIPQYGLVASTLGLVVHVAAAYDAYVHAKRINAEAMTTDDRASIR